MPGSSVFSGGGGGVSATAVKIGLDSSIDIDALLLGVHEIRDAIRLFAVGGLQPIPTLQPVISGAPGQPIQSALLAPPGPGKALVVQIIAWYDSSAANGRVRIDGSDGVQYLDTPIANRAGLSTKVKLRENLGGIITLTAGGATVSGRINYAVAIESA
jgi:hypothetical protein